MIKNSNIQTERFCRYRWWSGVALLLAMMLAGTAGAQTDYSDLINDLERDIRRQMRGEDIAGAALVMIDGDRIVHKRSYGFAAAGDSRRMTDSTPMLIGDFAKIATSLGVLRLVESGDLDLDAPISDYVVLENEMREPWRSPRVRELLTHHAGYAPNRFAKSFSEDLPEGLKLINPLPRTQPPGTIYSYSQLGFQVAGRLIEVASGQSYAEFLAQTVFAPLGMDNAGFVPVESTALPHDRRGRQKTPLYPREIAALGLFGSINDLAALLKWTLAGKGDPLFSDELATEMSRPQNAHIALDLDNRVGLGWQLTNTGNHNARKILRLNSGTFRHRGLALVAPEESVAVAIIANSSAAGEFTEDVTADALNGMLEAKHGLKPPDDEPELPENLPLPAGATPDPMATHYSTPLGELRLEGDVDAYEIELVGRAFGAKLRDDGWYTVSFKLFGVISLRFSILAEVLIRPATLGGASVLLAHFRGSDLLLGTTLDIGTGDPALEAWAGHYRISNPDVLTENLEIEDVEMVFEDGRLYLEYEIPSSRISIRPRVPLVPYAPNRLYVPGLGINTGDTIRLNQRGERREIEFSGWRLVEDR